MNELPVVWLRLQPRKIHEGRSAEATDGNCAFRGAGGGFNSPSVSTFDRHLLREWLQILALVLAATVGLLLVQVLYDDFRSLSELGAGAALLSRYVAVRLPSFLASVLPLALLVSLLYTLGRLHRSNELTAMRAAGVGFGRMMAPVWVVGVLCCGLSWWLNTEVVPWSVEESRAIKEDLEFRSQSARALPADRVGAVYSVAFDNPDARRVWFFNRFARGTMRGHGVSVSELDALRRERVRIVAAEAWFDARRGGWMFLRGRELAFDAESGEQTASTPFAEKFAPGYHEDPELMLLIDRKATRLSLWELRELIAQLEKERSPKLAAYAVEYHGLIAGVVGPLIVIAIAIPFAVSGVRINPVVGVSKSIGLFFLYYVMSTLANSLGARGTIDPIAAAWLPNAGMVAIAGWFLLRLR
jgi:lipopolysaccharide export system permease protein